MSNSHGSGSDSELVSVDVGPGTSELGLPDDPEPLAADCGPGTSNLADPLGVGRLPDDPEPLAADCGPGTSNFTDPLGVGIFLGAGFAGVRLHLGLALAWGLALLERLGFLDGLGLALLERLRILDGCSGCSCSCSRIFSKNSRYKGSASMASMRRGSSWELSNLRPRTSDSSTADLG